MTASRADLRIEIRSRSVQRLAASSDASAGDGGVDSSRKIAFAAIRMSLERSFIPPATRRQPSAVSQVAALGRGTGSDDAFLTSRILVSVVLARRETYLGFQSKKHTQATPIE